jgi:hypothetical protein
LQATTCRTGQEGTAAHVDTFPIKELCKCSAKSW